MNVRQALSLEKRFLRIQLEERSSINSRYLQASTFPKYISHPNTHSDKVDSRSSQANKSYHNSFPVMEQTRWVIIPLILFVYS